MNLWCGGGRTTVLVAGLLIVAALLLGIVLHPLAVDDAFITYRYAHNLAAGNGFVYNLERPVLSTTAPLYALLLAGGALLWPDLPSLANTLAAIALWAAALFVLFLGRREGTPWVGFLAAVFLVVSPLLWLSLGLETAVLLALAIAAILAYQCGRPYWAAVLLALATLTRGDGLILVAIVVADSVLRSFLPWFNRKMRASGRSGGLPLQIGLRPERWPRALGVVGAYLAVMLPLLVWLTWQFGSPLPATLGAKISQSELGVTGFYAHTTYLQGLEILARARLAQSPLYALLIPAIVAGFIAMWRRARWVRLIAAWGGAHLAGYTLLGVTPYYWYYVPVATAVLCLAALGIVESARWGSKRLGNGVLMVALIWAVVLLVAFLGSDLAMVRALDGPVPPPDDVVSKVLPEAKVEVYEQVGRWLHDNTPANALVGVTEVGVMGYYAQRPMVDFLGLLELDVAEALGRGDLYWGLLRYQPDYLALTGVSPLYAYDLRADPWFQAAYAPVQIFDDPRFWGSPVTVYARRVDRASLVEAAAGGMPDSATRLDVGFGGQVRLLGAIFGEATARPGDVLALTLYWEALRPVDSDYTVFVHLLGEHERVIAQRDATPGLGAKPTSQWQPGQIVADPYLLALPEATYTPDEALWEVGLYEAQTGRRLSRTGGGDNVRFGAISVLPSGEPLHLDFGPSVLTGYDLDRLALAAGDTLHLTLYWEGEEPMQASVQLVGEAGNVAVQANGDLDRMAYSLTLGGDTPLGAYSLQVQLSDPTSGRTLPLLGSDGQPRSDRAHLTKVRLYARE
jgi:hypothetical protein